MFILKNEHLFTTLTPRISDSCKEDPSLSSHPRRCGLACHRRTMSESRAKKHQRRHTHAHTHTVARDPIHCNARFLSLWMLDSQVRTQRHQRGVCLRRLAYPLPCCSYLLKDQAQKMRERQRSEQHVVICFFKSPGTCRAIVQTHLTSSYVLRINEMENKGFLILFHKLWRSKYPIAHSIGADRKLAIFYLDLIKTASTNPQSFT